MKVVLVLWATVMAEPTMMSIMDDHIDQEPPPSAQQIVNFKLKTKVPIGVMTTSAGEPIEYKEATNTLNKPLIFNNYYIESMSHFVRERIDERVVHAKGAGGFGYFKLTRNFSDICKAALFSKVGKQTPVAVRFSPVDIEHGGIDTSRGSRGFAVKFYTEEGNWDLVGLNFPMFNIKDPVFFTSFIRSLKRNPVTNLIDLNMLWDFLTLRPENFFFFLMVFGDRGIPAGYRHMPGFSIHTYELVNKYGVKSFVRFHMYPYAGIKNLRSEQAMKISASDPDFATRDLYNAIERGDFPKWSVEVQVLSLEDVKNADFDVFDVTKVLSKEKYPLTCIGYIVLNKNAKNFFAEMEQLAFGPANLLPGVNGAPDKLFEARRQAYRDAHNYRLGANVNKILVNCPRNRPLTYNRDGKPPVKDNERGIPNYYPNSFNGPVPYRDENRPHVLEIFQDDPNNYEQASELYRNEMTKEERSRLIENILFSLTVVTPEIQNKAIKIYKMIHIDLGNRVQQGLLMNKTNYYDEDDVE